MSLIPLNIIIEERKFFAGLERLFVSGLGRKFSSGPQDKSLSLAGRLEIQFIDIGFALPALCDG